ncbi:PREDICTED: NADH dehydrogenase [ubiquinone] 1 subunit C2 [Nicrophorus vespilloides]|uniref:NADH dehydrogenase [ubiquinone] 1 subunit C2 n=1 Tax=Nicrophorus vespilloides TaxID=110193 RepID=A0ABM1M7X0_NICVS|nr:PREDICTED: NADH dehydrogenase [ubiquinone] 1 subunit C2 [Nicrophorus vespilloides]
MATGPRLSANPLEILTPDLSREEPFLNKYYGFLAAGSLCLIGSIIGHYSTKRPILSGVHRHAAYAVIGGALGQYFGNLRNQQNAERDAVFRHYIQLHPEDFPDFERKKYSEIFEPWIPIR